MTEDQWEPAIQKLRQWMTGVKNRPPSECESSKITFEVSGSGEFDEATGQRLLYLAVTEERSELTD